MKISENVHSAGRLRRGLSQIPSLLAAAGLLFLPASGALGQANAPAPQTIEELRERISQIISDRRYEEAEWGIKIASLDSGQILFEHDAGKLFSPASNSKLYTMAMVLDRLGPDYRIKTSLYARAKPDTQGVIQGDLLIYGRGDPTINAKLHGNDIFKALEPLVAAMAGAGVKQISGDLIGDDSYFHGPPFGSSWEWGDLQDYSGAEVSALTINDNSLTLNVKPGSAIGAPCQISFEPDISCLAISNRTRTVAGGGRTRIQQYKPVGENVVYLYGELPLGDSGSTEDVTMHNPAEVFANCLQEALKRRGITVGGHVRSVNWQAREIEPFDESKWIELGYCESLPMREVIGEVMKPSQNLYTDLLLDHVGAKAMAGGRIEPLETAEDFGVRELNKFLEQAGVRRGETIFDEGSGLSRNNVTTPNATVTLLKFMRRHKDAQVYYESLPIAGVDGTLKKRMKGTPAQNNLRAKTGTLHWANSLSGYVTTAAGEHLAFSIMLNRYQSRDRSKTADLDLIGAMLAGFTGRTVKGGG